MVLVIGIALQMAINPPAPSPSAARVSAPRRAKTPRSPHITETPEYQEAPMYGSMAPSTTDSYSKATHVSVSPLLA